MMKLGHLHARPIQLSSLSCSLSVSNWNGWYSNPIHLDQDTVKNLNNLTPEQHRKVRNIIRWQRIGCIVVKISEMMNISLKEALDMFYRSETCRRFHDEETGLYLQGNLYILNDFLAEISASA